MPKGGPCGLSRRGSARSCTFHYIMSDLGNPDVPRSWADASEDLYSPVSVSLSLFGEAGLSTNEDTHIIPLLPYHLLPPVILVWSCLTPLLLIVVHCILEVHR